MSIGSQRIFIVDDEPLSLRLLCAILRTTGHAIEAFARSEALLSRLSPSDRGCIVLDLQMPGLNGLELQKALAERGILLPWILVSGRADVPMVVAAMKQGALDFLTKPLDPAQLCAQVARALERDAEVARERASREEARARWDRLSPREAEVCRLFVRGLLNKQIAAELGVTESTAQAQRGRALQKLEISTVVELVRLMDRVTAMKGQLHEA